MHNKKFLWVGEGSWNQGTLINVLLKYTREKTSQRKNCEFFLLNTLKITPWIENLTQRWRKWGPFFSKITAPFLILKKRQGKPRFQLLSWSSHMRCSIKQDVLINVAIFIGNHLRQSLFFKKSTCIYNFFSKTRLKHKCFLINSVKLLRSSFFRAPDNTHEFVILD